MTKSIFPFVEMYRFQNPKENPRCQICYVFTNKGNMYGLLVGFWSVTTYNEKNFI